MDSAALAAATHFALRWVCNMHNNQWIALLLRLLCLNQLRRPEFPARDNKVLPLPPPPPIPLPKATHAQKQYTCNQINTRLVGRETHTHTHTHTHARARAHTHTRTHTHAHARAHTHTHIHTHRERGRESNWCFSFFSQHEPVGTP